MNLYVPLLVVFALSLVVAVAGLLLSELLGPRTHNRIKLANYECGIEPTPRAGSAGRFPIKYYLTAMTFIVFDIEVVFMYPWAVSFHRAGGVGLIAMLLFIGLITVPYVYEWRRGGLEWDR